MKKTMGSFIIVFMITLSVVFASGGQAVVMMSDIDQHWMKDYQPELYLLQHLQIFSGYSDGSFKPDNQITRAEFVKILVTSLGPAQEIRFTVNSFQDVQRDHWAFPYIETAVLKGLLVAADYQGHFQPQQPITRQEMAVLLARALEKPAEVSSETGFADQEQISPWARSYVTYTVERGIINGYETPQGLRFKPNQTATRAEAALMITRLLGQANPLKQIGFYAIDSYKQLNTMAYFDEVAFGWSTLTKTEDGKITLTLQSKESSHRLPNGYQEPMEFALQSEAKRTLMLTEARTDLIYPLLTDKAAQEALIEAIVNTLKEYEFSGIVMDLENIRNTEKEYSKAYSSLLADLKEALRPYGYQLTVAVQPRNVAGYYDGYDFQAIGKAADEVVLMAHDYYDRRSTLKLTDHAPLPKVQEALVDILELVPKEKVILGLQVAGGTQFRINDQGVTLYTPTMTGIYGSLASKVGSRAFDYQTMTPTFQYSDSITGQVNTIRFEDYNSLNSKILMAKYYGIKGVSLWRIGEIQQEMLPLLQ